MLVSFLGFLALFVIVGLSSFFHSRGTKQDYYLASQSIRPSLVGLSAVATNNSGYMFIGVIGYTYATGFAAIWLMLGWLAGDYLSSMFVHRRLRRMSIETGELSYAGVLSSWTGGQQPALQRVLAMMSLIFLLAYASAQLVAGSKALQVLFGWHPATGVIIGTVMVALYCVAGGIRASIWTDVAQSIVMISAMGLLLVVATTSLGGPAAALAEMSKIDGFLDLSPKDTFLPGVAGALLFIAGWAVAGFSVIGQPHIMVRFMTLDSGDKMKRARLWYYLWFFAFYLMATAVGMLARIYLADTGSFDPELALPTIALQLLPPVLVGLILAGVFAATMSTADSLILSCSSALTHDLLPHKVESSVFIKLTTIAIAVAAMVLALMSSESVFSLVILAWSGLGSAFAPLLLVLVVGLKPGEKISIVAAVAGLITVMLWRHYGLQSTVYEGLPGMLVGLVILVLPQLLKK